MSERRTILLDGRPVAYSFKRSRRRTIGFSVSHDGLSVTAPQRASLGHVEEALCEKSRWILDKLDKWADRPEPRSLAFRSGEIIPWLGGDLRLEIEERGVRTRVRHEAGRLVMTVDPALDGALRERTLKSALMRYFKREGLALMAPKVQAYAAALDRSVAKVVIRDQKRRWGSCAPDGTIRLNWRLMGFPEALIDYVCAHEAAHLVEVNHSPAYWAVVEQLMPDWKPRRQRMRDEAHRWVAF